MVFGTLNVLLRHLPSCIVAGEKSAVVLILFFGTQCVLFSFGCSYSVLFRDLEHADYMCLPIIFSMFLVLRVWELPVLWKFSCLSPPSPPQVYGAIVDI